MRLGKSGMGNNSETRIENITNTCRRLSGTILITVTNKSRKKQKIYKNRIQIEYIKEVLKKCC